MNSKVETQGSSLDPVKMLVAVLLLSGAVVAFYWFADQSLLLRVIGLLVATGVSLAIASQTSVGRKVLGVMQDSRSEVRKVVWPSRAETVQTTLAVFLMVIVVGIMLWLMDMFLGWAVRWLTSFGG